MKIALPTSAPILKSVARLDHFRGAWAGGHGISAERLERIRDASAIQSVAASARIAGIKITDAEVAALMHGESPPNREGHEILAYAAALERSFPALGPLATVDEIQRLHAAATGRPGASPLRTEPFHLEVFDNEGMAIGRVFQTLPPRLVPEKLEEMVTWLELELRGNDHHPVLVIGTFMLLIVASCPFGAGNGRTAHLLVLHLLRRSGYDFMPYASIEQIFESMRQEYFAALDRSATRLWSGEADLEPWLSFYLDVLEQHCDRVQSKMDLERRAMEFTPLQRKIMETVRDHGIVAAGILIEATGANRNTLKDNLRRMVDGGLLERLGERRGARYRLATGEPPPPPER